MFIQMTRQPDDMPANVKRYCLLPDEFEQYRLAVSDTICATTPRPDALAECFGKLCKRFVLRKHDAEDDLKRELFDISDTDIRAFRAFPRILSVDAATPVVVRTERELRGKVLRDLVRRFIDQLTEAAAAEGFGTLYCLNDPQADPDEQEIIAQGNVEEVYEHAYQTEYFELEYHRDNGDRGVFVCIIDDILSAEYWIADGRCKDEWFDAWSMAHNAVADNAPRANFPRGFLPQLDYERAMQGGAA